MSLVILPRQLIVDINGEPRVGSRMFIYDAGTNNLHRAYTTKAYTIQHAQPILAAEGGIFPVVEVNPDDGDYKIVVQDNEGADIYTEDNRSPAIEVLTPHAVGDVLYTVMSAERVAGLTPDTTKPYGTLLRYGSNASPGVTDMATALQAAVDQATDIYAEVYVTDDVGLSKPVLIRSTTQQNISIVGNGRVSTIVRPLAADIKQSSQNVNALVINQGGNTHLHLTKFRCLDATAYTGVFLYCKEGGCADGSGQALFSAVVDDSWFAFSSNNTGIFRGGFSNLMVHKCVFEGTKTGCFIVEGAGNSDQQYIGNVMNACYDSFIYGAYDTVQKATITVDVLHAYQHMRGPLFEISNGTRLTFSNVYVESDVSNVGDTGIAKLTDCDAQFTNVQCFSRSGVPRAATCFDFVNNTTARITGGRTDATTGVKFSGTGALDVVIDNFDFIGCDNAIDFSSGTLSGNVVLRGCRLNNSQAYAVITTAGTHSWNLTLIDCEVMNAGLRGTTTDRNFDLNTSGKVRIINTKFGQDNLSAAATHYIRAVGSGTIDILSPIIVGTAPTAVATGSQAINFVRQPGYGGVVASASAITLPESGDIFQISGTTSITSISGDYQENRRVTLIFQDALTFTDGSNLRLASNFVTTTDDSITLVCINSVWFETSRSAN